MTRLPLILAAILTLAACGGGGTGTQPAASPEATVTGQQPGTAESTTTTAPEYPLPVELQGTWLLATATATNPTRMYLRETSYALVGHSGTVEAEGDVLTFTSNCFGSSETTVGRYRWTLEGDKLHIAMIGKDQCGGRGDLLADATYERTG